MKKVCLLSLLAVLLFNVLCAGCAGDEDIASRVTDYYTGLTTMTVQAAVTAEFSEYAVDFVLSFRYDAQGESLVEVEKPLEIEGVKVRFEDDGTSLHYDGVTLEVGVPEETVISPVAVLPELLRLWSGGVIYEQGRDKIDGTDCLLLTYKSNHNETELLCRTWFDAITLKPVKADIFTDGMKKMDCAFLIAENFK